ncbi:late embryogenesis abundant protein [Senna tora]|uniref:Late embryogenesis abundant protein n=1 Tax=Senna tora TaxID=362788 RepID=A0A834WJF3_9FABA|nr:late embryogenesis abundant protein [Senna tora]
MKAESRRRMRVCVAVTAALVVAIVLVIVILAFTVFKAKRPVTAVDSVSVRDMDMSLDIARLRVNLNVSLDVHISVTNPNKVGFRYSDSTALLNYRGQLIGEAPIPAGRISSGGTAAMNLTLTIMADRLLSTSQLFSDVTSGSLPLNTWIRISGRVSILGFIKVRVISTTSCDFSLSISNRTIEDKVCHYKTKL